MRQNQPGCECGCCGYCVSHGNAMVVSQDAHLKVTGFDEKKKQ